MPLMITDCLFHQVRGWLTAVQRGDVIASDDRRLPLSSGTLALGLAAGALLHKLFIKAPVEVSKGMTVVQAKRMGFQELGGKGPIGIVSAIDDDEDDEDDEAEEDEEAAPPKKVATPKK